jgi:hypothetical protein
VGAVSAALINFVNTPVPFILVLLVILSSLSCAVFTHRNPFVKDLIKQGWSPLFGAMVISSGSGIVLDIFASRYDGFPLLAIVISGLFPLSNAEQFSLTRCCQVYQGALVLYLFLVYQPLYTRQPYYRHPTCQGSVGRIPARSWS